MKIIATNLGSKKQVEWKGKTITTGIYKEPVDTPVFIDDEHVRGDTICNLKYHGGVEQAVYGYALEHYAYWKEIYPDLVWEYGMFGENLTIEGLDETKIHVGDVFEVGEVILEVTKPREPCSKLGIRFGDMNIVKQFWNTSYSGIYFKVLQTGYVSKGTIFKQVKSCPNNPTISEVYQRKKKQ